MLDTTFNTTGYKGYKFDATNDRPDEALFGAAVSPNGMFAAAAGYRNAGTVAGNNDDAVLVIIPLGGTAPSSQPPCRSRRRPTTASGR